MEHKKEIRIRRIGTAIVLLVLLTLFSMGMAVADKALSYYANTAYF